MVHFWKLGSDPDVQQGGEGVEGVGGGHREDVEGVERAGGRHGARDAEGVEGGGHG